MALGDGRLGGQGWGVVVGCPIHTCTHMYMHTCTHTHMHTHTCMCGKHDNFMQMAAAIGGIPGNSIDVICVYTCVHVCACACVWRAPSHHPHPQGTPGISQNSIPLELIKIFQFYLKI